MTYLGRKTRLPRGGRPLASLDRLFASCHRRRAWSASLGLGLVLAPWLGVQAALIGFRWPIQYITGMNGLLIIVLALVPSVQKHNRLEPRYALPVAARILNALQNARVARPGLALESPCRRSGV